MNSGTMFKDAFERASKEAQSRDRGLEIYFTREGIQFRLHDCAGSDQFDTYLWEQLDETDHAGQIPEGFAQMVLQLDEKLRRIGK